eukprot:CAMPEP_0185776336 /NCGR_PEP_ID=MMETSP1174-20130828/85285_1 /TAXON_ID=35687 /ORGANISM="Dictyocha speculum, Strain CCMP1381" /LENGTH=172 /DNA_ID=CAMNT_0028464245 /DNA_START=63 /DNA_END=578 /DNA_ORIENTATION=+
MVVSADIPDIYSIRSAVNGLSDKTLIMMLARFAVEILQQQDSAPATPPEDSKTEPMIRFGSVPHPPPPDTPSPERGGTTEEEATTPGLSVQNVENTRTVANSVKKHKDKKMWSDRRHEDNMIYEEIKELSRALGLEKPPCPRHRKSHYALVKVRTRLKKDLTQQKKTAAQKA